MVRGIVAIVLCLQLFSVSALASIQRIGGHLEDPEHFFSSQLLEMTPDGRYVLFSRYGGNNMSLNELYIYDRQNNSYEIVASSLNDLYFFNGTTADMSNNGNKIAYFSYLYPNHNLSIYDRTTGNTTLIPLDFSPDNTNIYIDSVGRYLAYSKLVEWRPQVYTYQAYIYDTGTGSGRLISDDLNGGSENNGTVMCISDNGRYVVLGSIGQLTLDDEDQYGDTFIYDIESATITKVLEHPAYAQGYYPLTVKTISDDGQKLLMAETMEHMVPAPIPDPARIFVYDVQTQTYTEDVTFSTSGIYANHDNQNPNNSQNGRYVVFQSYATNLVGSDNNGYKDIFRRDRIAQLTQRVSIGNDGIQGNNVSMNPIVSDDGRVIAFESYATNFVLNTPEYYRPRIYVVDWQPFTIKLAEYDQKKHTLTVSAASDLSENNSMILENYGAMTYRRGLWEIIINNVGANPGSITVTGIEGSVTVPTTVK